MAETFHHQERSYIKWIHKYPNGYVFNFFGGANANYNKLHHASCTWLGNIQLGKRTSVKKVCDDNLKRLEKEATRLRGSEEGWTYCKVCFQAKGESDENIQSIVR